MAACPPSFLSSNSVSGVAVTGAAAANDIIGTSSGTAATWQLGLLRQAATANAGIALINGTQNFVSWTTPNDGNNHRAQVMFVLDVTVAQTGGATGATFTAPDGTVNTNVVFLAGSNGTGSHLWGFNSFILAPNTTLTVLQQSAQTVGTSVAYAEIWGS